MSLHFSGIFDINLNQMIKKKKSKKELSFFSMYIILYHLRVNVSSQFLPSTICHYYKCIDVWFFLIAFLVVRLEINRQNLQNMLDKVLISPERLGTSENDATGVDAKAGDNKVASVLGSN
jgi:uncharacterized membrane protein YadS